MVVWLSILHLVLLYSQSLLFLILHLPLPQSWPLQLQQEIQKAFRARTMEKVSGMNAASWLMSLSSSSVRKLRITYSRDWIGRVVYMKVIMVRN